MCVGGGGGADESTLERKTEIRISVSRKSKQGYIPTSSMPKEGPLETSESSAGRTFISAYMVSSPPNGVYKKHNVVLQSWFFL